MKIGFAARIFLLAFTYLILAENTYAQKKPKQYTLYLTDKNFSNYSLDRPLEFLSQRAIDRRAKQGIELDETDLPVSLNYISILANDGLKILFTSAWQNTVTVQTTDSLFLDHVKKYQFVRSVSRVQKKSVIDIKTESVSQTEPFFGKSIYGNSFNQINIHRGQDLHNNGYRGQGMYIAVIDAGFWQVDTLKAFRELRQRHGILGTHDFVTGNDSVYEDATHGMYVLSTMAGKIDGKLLGTAPEANYFLLRTETATSESLTEEFAWIAALEWADSAGVDVVNSSLGYSNFDDPATSHTYKDMNGETTPISKAASMAASKGMVLVSSAGNSGAAKWHYITAPADAKNIISVAAIDSNSKVAKFSSRGPSVDGRVKPDVAAIGVQTVVAAATDGEVIGANGTSTAAPVIAGLVTCLWQEFPNRTAFEVMDAVRKSAHLYSNPNDSFGYGIPNFNIAREILRNKTFGTKNYLAQLYPNPFENSFTLSFFTEQAQTAEVILVDAMGRIVWRQPVKTETNALSKITIQPNRPFPHGVYIVAVQLNDSTLTAKLVRD